MRGVRWLAVLMAALLGLATACSSQSTSAVQAELSARWIMGLHSHDWARDFFALAPASEQPFVRHPSLTAAWDELEPERGRFDWAKLDEAFDLLESKGCSDYLLTLDKFVPSWAGPKFGPPEDLNDWRDFVRAVARHCGDRVDFYQVWNEPANDPNADSYKRSGALYFGGDFETDYPPMLRAAYEEIKRIDPRSYVICGAMNNDGSGIPENGASLYLKMTDAEHHVQDWCDAFAFHPYYNPPDWGRFYSVVKAALEANGVSKELVATEVGWLHNLPDGLEMQRQAIGEQGIGSLVDLGCRKFWVYQDLDDPPGRTFDFDYGLLDWQGNCLPAWDSYKSWLRDFDLRNEQHPTPFER